ASRPTLLPQQSAGARVRSCPRIQLVVVLVDELARRRTRDDGGGDRLPFPPSPLTASRSPSELDSPRPTIQLSHPLPTVCHCPGKSKHLFIHPSVAELDRSPQSWYDRAHESSPRKRVSGRDV